ncbi:phosphatidylinositol 5-phosphate 4-kinase type-2 gamma isoform X44 [Serinus canaria]|uniref:phosphatidylinositol 5-phosphate 4-kinase type-2 gamma isoform X43 n=1 Tax=Serinus canaria TaxID=9135 RepID=UPI0021CC9B5A|nr:phosphatidylinositol 5-phosphate 4-kinase type-2 gamma isoform X43 [Serinus canaria]XP_050839924.1 phosphatidylinositol 5-phosphate 4-kinase type-2 gamma isoform X44 [Serinus canaria]
MCHMGDPGLSPGSWPPVPWLGHLSPGSVPPGVLVQSPPRGGSVTCVTCVPGWLCHLCPLGVSPVSPAVSPVSLGVAPVSLGGCVPSCVTCAPRCPLQGWLCHLCPWCGCVTCVAVSPVSPLWLCHLCGCVPCVPSCVTCVAVSPVSPLWLCHLYGCVPCPHLCPWWGCVPCPQLCPQLCPPCPQVSLVSPGGCVTCVAVSHVPSCVLCPQVSLVWLCPVSPAVSCVPRCPWCGCVPCPQLCPVSPRVPGVAVSPVSPAVSRVPRCPWCGCVPRVPSCVPCPHVSLARSPPRWVGSGRRLLLSADRTLVLKELSSEDVADVHGLLAHYHQYVVQCHGQTLLPRFLGMYRVSVDSEDTYLLVMRNLFSHRLPVHRKYDLKGSLVDREASDKEKGKELPTLKDVDFLNKNEKVFVEEEQQRDFMDKLKRDVEFLVQQKLMDYSLLLGIHEVERGEQEEEEELEEEELGGGDDGGLGGPYGTSPEGLGGLLNSYRPLGPGEFDPGVDVYALRGAEGAPRREVYFMGLIDVLTQYDARKKAAHAAKTVKHGAGAEISTVHPEQYAKRFLDFITNIFA